MLSAKDISAARFMEECENVGLAPFEVYPGVVICEGFAEKVLG